MSPDEASNASNASEASNAGEASGSSSANSGWVGGWAAGETPAVATKSQEGPSQAGQSVHSVGVESGRLNGPSESPASPAEPLAHPHRGEPLMPIAAEMPPPAPHPMQDPFHQGMPMPPAGGGAFHAGGMGAGFGAAGWNGPAAAGSSGNGPAGGFGGGGGAGAPYWRGQRLVDPRVSDADRAIAVIMHLWWLGLIFTAFFPLAFLPVILWAVRQSASGFVDDHGREVLNTQLTILLFAVSIIGLPVAFVLILVSMVNSVRGAIAAAQREHFRYGMIFRPIG